MDDEARLTTEFRVQVYIRRANARGDIVTVLRRGDATAGALAIRLTAYPNGERVLIETRNSSGKRAWLAATGGAPVGSDVAEAYLARAIQRDRDLWVIEIEDRGGESLLDEPIVAG